MRCNWCTLYIWSPKRASDGKIWCLAGDFCLDEKYYCEKYNWTPNQQIIRLKDLKIGNFQEKSETFVWESRGTEQEGKLHCGQTKEDGEKFLKLETLEFGTLELETLNLHLISLWPDQRGQREVLKNCFL